jgi:hypothetical protein
MSAPAVLSSLVCLGFFVAGLVVGRRVWHNEWGRWAFHPDHVPGWWPYGGALWRGWLRTIPLAWAMLGLVGAALPLLSAGGILRAAGLAAGTLVMGGILLAAPVILFSRPRFVVLPHFRHQPGAVGEWRGAPVPPTPVPRDERRPGAA